VKTKSPQEVVDIAARTRAARRRLIERFISTTRIHSQRELQQMLTTHGFNVTQATLSRDLKATPGARPHPPPAARPRSPQPPPEDGHA